MRRIQNLMEQWLFIGPDNRQEQVNLPHTWNAKDGQDGGNDYYRGTCHYEKTFEKPEFDPEAEEVYLEFLGVNASSDVTVNGKELAHHDGGYSTFRINITEVLEDRNKLEVTVDNSVNGKVYPQKADFTFYGGIYRDVRFLIVSKEHFDLDYLGSNGIKITPEVKENEANVHIETFTNTEEAQVNVQIKDQDGKVVAEGNGCDVNLNIQNPIRWHGRKNPYLYTAAATLTVNGEVKDEITPRFGIRTFSVDPKKGFFLNGEHYPLHGVSRHQDFKALGNAISTKNHDEDMDMICELGANTIRLAHYQHDQYFYDLCDERGMVVWAEIPYISEHMPGGRENTISQMRELIVQNYNHPSIVVWGVSNEITISTKDKKDMLDNHHVLNDLCHKMDPTRLTTLACYAMCGPFNRSAHITDLVGWNLYLGWYVPGFFLNDLFLRFFHLIFPNRPIGYSEYGAEGMPNLHSRRPRRGDHTEEYQAKYHEDVIRQIAVRPWLWSTHVWNMFDFAADARSEGGENGMNHKGLVTFDRKYKKDSFYAYKAWLSDEPFVHICGKRYIDRPESVTSVTVYTNEPSVELFANGKSLGVQKRGEFPFFYFSVPNEGETVLTAKAGDCTDESRIRKVDKANPDYVLQEEGAVINWFEIETPPGYMSVNDTIGDILATAKGKLLALKILKMVRANMKKNKGKSTGGMADMAKGMKINKSIIEMGKGFSVKRVCMMAGGLFTKEQILEINASLNKIKKKQK